jgi:hypothetical protein
MIYEYPKVTGYEWNALQRISLALNIPMENICSIGISDKTCIGFNNIDLTEEQKAILDNIMIDNPCAVLISQEKTTYQIADLWNMRQWFFSNWGISPTIWFEDGNEDGTGECYIYLQFPRLLSETEKNQIVSVYANSIKEKV